MDALIFQRKATRAGISEKIYVFSTRTFQFVGLPHSDVANFSDPRLFDAETASLSESAWRVLQLSSCNPGIGWMFFGGWFTLPKKGGLLEWRGKPH